MKVAFRVDADESIGIGHLMRCLALSEEFNRRGYSCFFVTKIENNELKTKIKKENYLFKINPNLNIHNDVKELINFSKKKDVNWIITDHYGLKEEYISEIKKKKIKVLSIDDNAQIHYKSDIVLNQNIDSENLNYSSENHTKFLLGPKYAILRDRLLIRENKTFNNDVKEILLMLGGTDKENMTLKLIKLLETVSNQIDIIVIIGPLNPNYNEIFKYVKDKKLKIKVIKSPEHMEKIYLNTDIAISAGGISCYELAYFGIPNLIITIAENQIKTAEGLHNQKVSIYLGTKNHLNKISINKKIYELINNISLRKTMSINGMKLVDGQGKKRIIDFMESFD